ncbi:MAG: hypothetical protein D6713_02415 [Deltaproteobacteria bacterium]|nr:MAG: hypothetical protein D6713_02415 [Deltaproteobacteria bacterium]
MASLLHATGGLLLTAGKTYPSFFLLSMSLLLHLMDSGGYPLLNALAGKAPITLYGRFSRGLDPTPQAVIFLHPAGPGKSGGMSRFFYRTGFAGGAGLWVLALGRLLGLSGGETAGLILILFSAAGVLGGGVWTLSPPGRDTREPLARLSQILRPREKQVWVVILEEKGVPQIVPFLRKYRSLLLPVPLYFVSLSADQPEEAVFLQERMGIISARGKGEKILPRLEETLKHEGFTPLRRKDRFDPVAHAAISRGFFTVSVTFHPGAAPEKMRDALVESVERTKS